MYITKFKSLLLIVFLGLLTLPFQSQSQSPTRWTIHSPGITWQPKAGQAHADHIEMSGQRISVVLRYGVTEEGGFSLRRSLVWPMLRTIPNNTHASLTESNEVDILDYVEINGRKLTGEQIQSIQLNGSMQVLSSYANASDKNEKVTIERTAFPSTLLPAWCEQYILTNSSVKNLLVKVPLVHLNYHSLPEKGVKGAYEIATHISPVETQTIAPGQKVTFQLVIQAKDASQTFSTVDVQKEWMLRKAYVEQVSNQLVLRTPDPILNEMFRLSKVRASESIFATQGGLMHGPGGESYYAAIWANDQAEYVNPFFPFLGYAVGNESAINSFRHFARFMNDEYRPIPSSIIAEGLDIWNGAGDRGDGAMIAYGASRFALAYGDRKVAKELWPLIEWTLEFCKRKINAHGVVASDSDELEGRFPAGDANLTTSCLYYDALLSAAYIAEDLKMSKQVAANYRAEAKQLRKSIESYFGGRVSGFDTYRYYEGNDVLRSWISIPLTVGIFNRAPQTLAALFSDRLWHDNGLLTQEGSSTYWDRSTLYSLRGAFAAGATDQALPYLKEYSKSRLLGDHVPYAIEAWPEGSQRHLSAESGLYARIFVEGVFGVRPTGLRSFTMTPQLPTDWDFMELNQMQAFGKSLDLQVTRVGKKLKVRILEDGQVHLEKIISSGQTLSVPF